MKTHVDRSKVLPLLFVFLILTAVGETQSQCWNQFQYCPLCGDPVVPGATCVSEGPFLMVCTVPSNKCAPPAAPPETGCGPCSGGPGGPGGAGGPRGLITAGEPINLANGNTYIVQTDLSIPGLGGGLALTRTWNSRWPQTQSAFQSGLFGPNWRSTFEERVFVGSDGTIKYSRSDGSFWSFGYTGSGWEPAAPANVVAVLTQGPSYWTLRFKNGEQRLFNNTSGSLIAVVDRNGNTTGLSYDEMNRLVGVVDPGSRHLSFSYNNSSYPYQATGVTSDVGMSLSYLYDDHGRLITVTKPDNTTTHFEYNDESLITAVKDSDGKVLESHTYDNLGRGLTSSRANGVDAITLSY